MEEGEISAVGDGGRANDGECEVSVATMENASAHHGAVRPPRK